MTRTVNYERYEEILELVKQKTSWLKITEILKCSRSTISKAIRWDKEVEKNDN